MSMSDYLKKNDLKEFEENIKRHFDVAMEDVKGQFKLLGEQVATVSEDVEMLKDDMDEVKSDIVDIKIELKSINRKLDKKAEQEVVEKHEKRIVKLENAVLVKA